MRRNLANEEERAFRRKPIATLAAPIFLACLLAGGHATAQVLEIQDDGSVVTYDGPTQVLSAHSGPISLRSTSPRRGDERSTYRGGIRIVRYESSPPLSAAGVGAVAMTKDVSRRGSVAPTAVVAQALQSAAARHQISEALVEAVAWQESGFNPLAVSPKGARGMMQLMPQTARLLGVNADDEISNIEGGADYLSRMMRRFGGDTTKALAAYNAGPEAVERYGGVPPYAETMAYVGAILSHLNRAAKTSPVALPPASESIVIF